MSYSPSQKMQRNEAIEKARHYAENMNVTGQRQVADGRPDEFRGKGMMRQTEAEEALQNGYKVKTGESC
jgi:hypothetical protein